MKKSNYLTVSVISLALLALGCSQIAPVAPSQSDVVLQVEDEVVLPLSAGVIDAPGNCCPEVFVRVFELGNAADRNGDNFVCRMVTPEGTITIDNNVPGDCCVPPEPCGGGTD